MPNESKIQHHIALETNIGEIPDIREPQTIPNLLRTSLRKTVSRVFGETDPQEQPEETKSEQTAQKKQEVLRVLAQTKLLELGMKQKRL